jgi:hypothetical protein
MADWRKRAAFSASVEDRAAAPQPALAGESGSLSVDPAEALQGLPRPPTSGGSRDWRSRARSEGSTDVPPGGDAGGEKARGETGTPEKPEKKDKKRRKSKSRPSGEAGEGGEAGAEHEQVDGAAVAVPGEMDEVTLADIRAASLLNASQVDQPRLRRMPTWLLQWADAKLLTEQDQHVDMAASDVVRLRVQQELQDVRMLAALAARGQDGSGFGVPASAVEGHEPDPSVLFDALPPEETAFWFAEGAARVNTESLGRYVAGRLQELEHLEAPIGPPFRDGADGAAATPELDLSGRIRKTVMQRAIMQDLFVTPNIGASRHDTVHGLHRDYFSMPSVHSSFICGKDTFRPDHAVIRSSHPFEPTEHFTGSNAARGHNAPLKRIISVNLGMFRFADHALFWPEMTHVSTLLGAYTRYRLLTANLLPEKGRQYYQALHEDLQEAYHMLVKELGPLVTAPPVNGGESPPDEKGGRKKSKRRKEKEAAAAAAEAEAPPPLAAAAQADSASATFTTTKSIIGSFETEGEKDAKRARLVALERDLREVDRHLHHATAEERQLLETMWRAWSHVQMLRRGQHDYLAQRRRSLRPHQPTAAAAEQPAAADDAAATADAPSPTAEAHHPPIYVDFVLRRISDEAIAYEDGADIMLYRPVLSTLADAGDGPDTHRRSSAANGVSTALPAVVVASVYARHTIIQEPTFVGRTEPAVMDSAFSASFNATFELHTAADPHDIIIQISDYHSAAVIATFNVPPALSSTTRLMENPAYGDPKSVVQLTLSTSWVTSAGLPFEAIEDLFLRGEADPLDPRNAPLLAELRKRYGASAGPTRGGGSVASNALRRVADDIAPAPYVMRDERLKLLNLRDRLVRGVQVPADAFEVKLMDARIPATEFEVKQLVRKLRLQVMEEEADARDAVNTDVAVAMGARDPATREQHLKLWQAQLKKKKLKVKVGKPQDHERLAQIITLPPVPSIGALIAKFTGWFVPRSKLRPDREDAPSDTEVAAKLKRGLCQIVVHVMKAENFPRRLDGSPTDVIAELSFVSFTSTSSPQQGSNPSWFETLAVPFKPPDFDPTTLALIDDMITINFYDQVNVTINSENATSFEANKTVQFRVERRFLGCVQMPFYSVHETDKCALEGQYTVLSPRLIMGYYVPDHAPTANLYFSVWPPVPARAEDPVPLAELIQQVRLQYPTKEQLELYDAAFRWKAEMDSRQAGIAVVNPLAGRRTVFPFVTTSNGEPMLITRYILPQGIRCPKNITTMPQAIRFVSLFPFVVDLAAGDEKDVWSTMSEFLEAGGGDYEELALLLLHLLRQLTKDPTYLIVGHGDIYAEATYVLTIINANWMIIDPRTGDVFPTDDPRCGLTEVAMVVSDDQVWGNVQLSGTPYRMVWNLDDERAWMPLFKKEHEQKLRNIPTIQRSHLNLGDECPEELVVQVELDVRRKMQNLLREWRKDRGLRFDKGVAGHLKSVLEQLEAERSEFASFHQTRVDEEQNAALNHIIGVDFQPIGYPIHHPYVAMSLESADRSLNELFQAVKETAVHEVGAPNVRYSVAVHVRGYTKQILSVWVYVVALVPLR